MSWNPMERIKYGEIGGIDQERFSFSLVKAKSDSMDMGGMHCFHPDVAVKYGVGESIILNRICSMMLENIKNKANKHAGLYWTLVPTDEVLTVYHPYFSVREYRGRVENLIKAGAILKANWNTFKLDPTLWYTVVDNFVLEKYGLPTVYITGNGRKLTIQQLIESL